MPPRSLAVAAIGLVCACGRPSAQSVSITAPSSIADARAPEPVARPSFCHPYPYDDEAPGAIECVLPDPPTQSDLDALRSAPSANVVDLRSLMQHGRSCSSVTDFSALSALDHLASLNDVPAECFPKLQATASIGKLERLDFYCGDGTAVDMHAIATLTRLRRLRLGLGCGRGPDGLAPLGALAGLEELHDIDDDLAGVRALAHLRKLYVTTGDIRNLAGMTGLEVLSLDSRAADYGPLRGLTNLRELTIRTATPGFDPAVLAGMRRLEVLEVLAPGVKDLSHLSGLSRLRALTLDASAASSIAPLASLTSLEKLTLYGGCSAPSSTSCRSSR